jgi:protein-S-isoprenylcysteine O-methyltransferase Ste14
LRPPGEDGTGPANSLPGILAAVAAVAVWDLAWSLSGGSRYALVRHPALWAGLGIAVGGIVWSQRF